MRTPSPGDNTVPAGLCSHIFTGSPPFAASLLSRFPIASNTTRCREIEFVVLGESVSNNQLMPLNIGYGRREAIVRKKINLFWSKEAMST